MRDVPLTEGLGHARSAVNCLKTALLGMDREGLCCRAENDYDTPEDADFDALPRVRLARSNCQMTERPIPQRRLFDSTTAIAT